MYSSRSVVDLDIEAIGVLWWILDNGLRLLTTTIFLVVTRKEIYQKTDNCPNSQSPVRRRLAH